MTQSLNSAPQKQKFSVAINSKMYQNLIASTLRDPARARRFTAAITSAVAVNPALQECDAGTILAGALLGESLNLSPSPQLGQYYLVPFKQKAKYDRGGNMVRPETTTATFVLGYKGYIQLALRSGQYKDLDVMVIKQGEYMGKDPETGKAKFQFIEDDDERETLPTIGYMAYFEYLNGFRKVVYWSKEKMMTHADTFSKAFSRQGCEDLMAGRVPEKDLRKFLLAKAVAGRQERTLRQYKDEVGRALRGIGKDADTITADDIQVYLAKVLSRGGSKCYCDNIRRDLSSFYNWLYREEIIRTNPMNKIDNIKFKREKEKALTDMEIEVMRQACQTTMQKAIMEMLLSTGCRAAELVSIKIADMDEDKVSILGKGGKWRTVYINAKAFVAIKNYLADRKDTNPYLFPREINTKDRTMISNFSRKDWFKDPRLVTKADHFGRDSVNNMVRTIGKRAGVKGVHAVHRLPDMGRSCTGHRRAEYRERREVGVLPILRGFSRWLRR